MNYIESQFCSRENGVEMFIKQMIKSKTLLNIAILRQFSTFIDKRPVANNITWEVMKKSYGWGFAKGSRIHSLVTWIYIRPDIKIAIQNDIITLNDVLKHLILNEHYFIVEKTAIEYLKNHCLRVFDVADEDDDEVSVILLITIYIYRKIVKLKAKKVLRREKRREFLVLKTKQLKMILIINKLLIY